MNRTTWMIPLALVAACGDEDGGNGGAPEPDRAEPTLFVQNPICLNQRPFPISGELRSVSQLITNRGEQTLEIAGGRIADEEREGAFTNLEFRDLASGQLCTAGDPCRLEFQDDVGILVDFTPPAPGWDRALIEIDNNDPDFAPEPFVLAIVSAAESELLAEDFGDRPESLICACRTPVPPECLN